MRNILSLKIETRVSLAIIFIVVVIFLITIIESLNNFEEFSNNIDREMSQQNYIKK